MTDGTRSAAVRIGGPPLTVADVVAVARRAAPVALADGADERIAAARAVVDGIVREGRTVYGINTGFGQLSHVRIGDDDLVALQHNLVRSHGAGVGEPLAPDLARAMALLLANSLARGHSGVRPVVVDRLVERLNAGWTPQVPSRGSVGASGDLAPLAHLAGALLDDGLALEPKEGLALLNGTHLMAAAAALLLHDARVLLDVAELAAALSLDVLLASVAPMDDRIHAVRGRSQQRRVAARVRAAVAGSELLASHAGCGRVQDAYTLRCIPQVLGAVAEGLDYLDGALAPELAAVTDNPLCFPADGEVVSGGNFHGQPLSLPLDLAAIALAELAGFSERRTFRLLDGRSDEWALPAFLTREAGTRSGLMLAQYTAAALVGELGVLAHPAGPTSLPTSAGQEDWNSMGATAGLKALRALELARQVVATELVCAAQALDLRRPLVSGPPLEELHARVRRRVPPLDDDRPPGPDLEAIAAAIAAGELAGILPSESESESEE